MRQEDQFQTTFILDKSIWFPAQFQNISIVLNLVFNKNKLYETLDYWSRNFLNFEFLEKLLVEVFTPHFFLHEFWRKIFFFLYFINWLIYFINSNCLVAFTSWDTVKYVYCNYLLTWLWRHITFIFLIKLFFLCDQKFKINIFVSWFSLNNSKVLKAVTLAFRSIQ